MKPDNHKKEAADVSEKEWNERPETPQKAENAKDASLEELFQELDGIIREMEDRDVPLERAFSLYEKGIGKVKQCNEKLDLVEKKMLVIANDGTTVPF